MDKAPSDAVIWDFVDKLIAERDFPSMDSRIRDQLRSDLVLRVQKYVTMSMISKLPPDKLADFQKLMEEKADDEAVAGFCKEHVSNLDEVVATALMRFRSTYLGQ